MIHTMHKRMDHRLSVPLSTQPLGLLLQTPGDNYELIFCPCISWDEQRRGTAHKCCDSELKLLMLGETYYK